MASFFSFQDTLPYLELLHPTLLLLPTPNLAYQRMLLVLLALLKRLVLRVLRLQLRVLRLRLRVLMLRLQLRV